MRNVFTATWQNPLITPRNEIVARLLISSLAIATTLLSFSAYGTNTHAMLQVGGALAYAMVVAVGVLGAMLLVETFINDMLPVRFAFHWARRHRQAMWMTLGMLFMCFAYLVFTSNLSVSLAVYLALYGAGSIMLAFVDAAIEKMQRRWAQP